MGSAHDDDHDGEGDGGEDEDRGDAVADADAMADELGDSIEDELADAIRGPGLAVPASLAVPGLVLTAAMAAPLHPDGFSFAQLLYAAFLRSPLEALVMLLGFGSPFCFGAIVSALALAGPRITPRIGERALVVNLSFLHAQLVLVAGLLVSRGAGMMPLALLGFGLVSGGYFILHHARESATGGGFDDQGVARPSGPSQRWLIRWGATVVVAVCGWTRLQLLVDVRLGWAVEVMLGACVAMTVLLLRRRPGA